MMTDTTLRSWLDCAWEEHAKASSRIAAELAERAPALPDDADGAEAVRLAEHVMLAHLADPAALSRFITVLPASDARATSVQRASWALATLAGEPEPPIADAPRWRALHSVVMTLVGRGQVESARERLLSEEAAAAASDDADARKAFAATANNTAADLCNGARGDAGRDALMLAAAALAQRAWQRAGGTWINAERADYRLAMCHAVVGQGAQAVAFADACLARCEAEGAEASERFFAHECCVHAQRAAGDAAKAEQHRSRMAALLAEISDPGMHGWCSETLATT